jgi:hypothetical protein
MRRLCIDFGRVRKGVRRIFVILAVAVGAIVTFALVGLALIKADPSYYRPITMSAEQIEQASKRVEDKLVEIRNVAITS